MNFFTPWNHDNVVMTKVHKRLFEDFEPLARNINLQLNSFEKSLVKEMKDDLKYVLSLEDEFDEKCLILDIQTEFFKTQFESTISESYSHVYENEMFEQNSSLESKNCCLKKTVSQFQKDFSKLEAHCINLEVQLKNNVLKSGQHGQILKETSNEVKLKTDIHVTESINIELECKVVKLLEENEHLKAHIQEKVALCYSVVKERENIKLEYQKLFNSIKATQTQHQKEFDELIEYVNQKTYAYADMRAQNQDLLITIFELKNKLQTVDKEKNVIELVLWIIDSGCSNHMTGNLQLLRNFVEKFMGTVRFKNDHFIEITGYGDYVQGNLTICHVYYVEGLGHNLFQ
ncbi:hypothetical protein Tco_0379467 [Tanacetum coccineum]